MIITTKLNNKINIRQLTEELAAVQPNASVLINKQMNWASFPYTDTNCPSYITPPADTSAPWTSPFVIEIQNGDEANRAAFEAVVAAHDPEMTDQEEAQNAQNQKRAQELLEALMTLPNEYLAQIKARFDALP